MDEPQQLLQGVLKTVAKEQKYDNYQTKIQEILTNGANYTSYLFLVTITETGKHELKLFAKVAAVGEKMQQNAQFYRVESFFYNVILKKYRELEDLHNVPEQDRLMVPTFYGGSSENMKEVLVLEDLNDRGFKTFDRFKSVTWEQASKSMEQLAKFHALSLALATKNPKEFERVKEGVKVIDMTGQTFKTFLKSIIPRVCEATQDKDKVRVSKFLEDTLNSDNFKYLIIPIRKSVVVHRDYRPSNLMFKYHLQGCGNNATNITEKTTNKEKFVPTLHSLDDTVKAFAKEETCQVIPLDFQTLRCNTPLFDVLYFINLGSDNSFRQKYFKATINHYYSELCLALRRLDVDPNIAYSKNDLEYEYKQILPYMLMISMCILIVVTVDEEKAPKGEELRNLDLEGYAFIPSQQFKEKLGELIDFYTDMGVL